VNLIPNRWRRDPRRAAKNIYFAIEENPRTEAARDTLRHSSDPAQRYHALDFLAERELSLYRTHDGAFGHQPWADDIAGDAATGLAYGVMALRLLRALEWGRTAQRSWRSHWQPIAWGRVDLTAAEQALADACGPLLDLLSNEDPTEIAVLYTRLWIAAYPIIGGQAAEWIAVLGNDWQCRAAGVQDGPDTILTIPDARYSPDATPNPA